MKIAVIGAGAIGGLVGGYLTKSGEDVLLIGRDDQVDAINRNGLFIQTNSGEEKIQVRAATRLDRNYDLVIFATKTQDLQQAYQDNKIYLDVTSWILTTQNGVQADNLLCTHFEPERIISSIVMFGATYIEPGKIVYNFSGPWILGKPYMVNDEKVFEIAEIFRKVFAVEITPDIMGMKWLKVFVNFNNCIPALIGKSMQETFADMDFCRLSIKLLKEGVDIVRMAGIELVSLPNFPADRILGLSAMPLEQSAGIINKTLTNLSQQPLYGSILQSIMRRKASEIDFINGEVSMVAKSLRRESPLNDKMVDLVHKVEIDGRFLDPEEVKREFDL